MASPSESRPSGIFRFGIYELDLARGELRKGGSTIRLQPQPFKVLELLVRRRGDLVTRDEIKEQLWDANTFVDFEQGLNFCIRQIRAALLDDAATPRYVETVPKRGYRFIAPISFQEGQSVEARTGVKGPVVVPISSGETATPVDRPSTPAPATAGEKTATSQRTRIAVSLGIAGLLAVAVYFLWSTREPSPAVLPSSKIMLAVLPFDNLTGDEKQEYLSDGMTEEMITQLGVLSPVRMGVIARTSSMSYKKTQKTIDQIGRELGVDYVLEGSLRQESGQIRVTAQLIQVKDQTHLWADNFDGSMSGGHLLAAQTNIAKRIAGSLSIALLANGNVRERIVKPEAYDAYLKGLYEWNKRNTEGIKKSIAYFQESVDLDPGYAPAHAGLANSYNITSEYLDIFAPPEVRANARLHTLKAIELDPALASAQTSLAFVLWRYDWNWAEAERTFQKALELDPNYPTAHHWYALFLASRGRFPEAEQEMRRALLLDPFSLIVNTNMGWIAYWMHDYDKAIAQYRKVLDINPSFESALVKLTWAYEKKGMWKEAYAIRQKRFLEATNRNFAPDITQAYTRNGYSASMNALLRQMEQPPLADLFSADEQAKLHAVVGDRNAALATLQKEFAARSSWLVYLKIEPLFDDLRSDPQFAGLVQKVGL